MRKALRFPPLRDRGKQGKSGEGEESERVRAQQEKKRSGTGGLGAGLHGECYYISEVLSIETCKVGRQKHPHPLKTKPKGMRHPRWIFVVDVSATRPRRRTQFAGRPALHLDLEEKQIPHTARKRCESVRDDKGLVRVLSGTWMRVWRRIGGGGGRGRVGRGRGWGRRDFP